MEPSLEGLLVGERTRARSQEPDEVRRKITDLYTQYRHAIFRLLVTANRNPAEAEELTQEAFLKLYISYRSGQSADCPFQWLVTVSKRLMIDRSRRRKWEAPQMEAAWKFTDGSPTAEEFLLEVAWTAQMDRALDSLKGLERRCLDLRMKGRRFREIASSLDIPISAAVAHTNRAITKVRRRTKP
jgi:RNA polymerase sigma-70 factor (ECF subfamily)